MLRLRSSLTTGLIAAAAGAIGMALMPLIEGLDVDYFEIGTLYAIGIGAGVVFLIWCATYPWTGFVIEDGRLRERGGRVYGELEPGDTWAVADGRIWIRRRSGETEQIRWVSRRWVNRRDWERLEAALAEQDG
ncbi:hypothetical protein [Glycomyces sp. MUSA5-2]|uniref:hypothetical protein n=1 Tax=Glycomyces sp. MUSA5-2 TaxID=2053002 RepID=UPI003008F79E